MPKTKKTPTTRSRSPSPRRGTPTHTPTHTPPSTPTHELDTDESDAIHPPASHPVATEEASASHPATSSPASHTSSPPVEHKTKSAPRLRSNSLPSKPIKPKPVAVDEPAVATRPRSRSTAATIDPTTEPVDHRAVLRLELGDATFARLQKLPVDLDGLSAQPGLKLFLQNKLKTDADIARLQHFLPHITGTPAAAFAAEPLDFLYARAVDFDGKPGLKTFLIGKLQDAADETELAAFHTDLRGLGATDLADGKLNFLYQRRADLKGKPGLSAFLAARLRAGDADDELDAFHQDIKTSPAAGLAAERLDFLYARRAALQNKPGFKDFLIAKLGAGESTADLATFHDEARNIVVEDFDVARLDFLYTRRATLDPKPGLKAFVVTRLHAQGNDAGLDDFIDAIRGTDAENFTAQKLFYLHALSPDFDRTATVKGPASGTFVTRTVREVAIERLSAAPTVLAFKEEMEQLGAFAYNERLYAFALAKARQRGDVVRDQELAALNAAEQQEIAAARDTLMLQKPPLPEGPEPPLSGRDKKKRPAWLAAKAAHDNFEKQVLPGLLATESVSITARYAKARSDLEDQRNAGKFAAPELEEYKKFVAAVGFHADAEWALDAASGDIDRAKLLFDACKGDEDMKQIGSWAGKAGYNADRLDKTLAEAARQKLNLAKTRLVVPYLLDCSVPETRDWLSAHAAKDTTTDAELKADIDLLRAHKAATQPLIIEAIGLVADKATLAQYNRFLTHPVVGAHLVALIKAHADTPGVMNLFKEYVDKQDALAEFLKATSPLPTGYASLDEVCGLVKLKSGAKGYLFDDVVWAIKQATSKGDGKGYTAHALTRLREGASKQDLTTRDFGYKEWLLVSQVAAHQIHASNSPYKGGKPGSWTGVFKVTVNGYDIEVHNHFVPGKDQYSLHLKDGASQGKELTPGGDKSVYNTISQLCLTSYTNWAAGRWAAYTI